MQVQRVITNETCNQNCWFCSFRRPLERPGFVTKAAVHQRIAASRQPSVREIVLTGGEPTLIRGLADLVREAVGADSTVVLETNGTLIDETRARELASAGLRLARVQLVAWGDEPVAEITRDPGGFAAALRGIATLASNGVEVEVTTPVVKRNLSLVR
ncbi:MAG TPA: radical SAM protein, partial [Candidatus Acidoferrales bacterium]|nr:radical SAM protein [Candidatus Acidoferrales bacterium]